MRKVPVDILMLVGAFESQGDEMQWYLDLETGDVIPVFDDPEEEERIESDPDRFLLVEPPATSGEDFRTMEEFVAGLPDGEAKRDLARVLRRAKPFRNFREALRAWPEIREQWFTIHNRRIEETAREWLVDHGIDPMPRKPTT